MSSATTTPGVRLLAPDVARGFMLALIALANVPLFAAGDSLSVVPTDGDRLSRVMEAVTVLFADGRAYPLFAMLFGFGLGVLSQRDVRAGMSPGRVRGRLAVRLGWLLAFGAVHGLVYPGDILGAYAIAGFIVLTVIVAGNQALWVALGISSAVWLMSETVNTAMVALAPAVLGSAASEPSGDFEPLTNLAWWALGSVAAALLAALPFILLGVLIQRLHLLEVTAANLPRARWVAVGAVTIGLLAAVPAVVVAGDTSFGQLLVAVARLFGPVLAVGYLAGFAVLCRPRPDRPETTTGGGLVVQALAATGRRSLTSYLLQTVLFVVVLTPWGPLGLSEHTTSGQERLLALGFWVVTVLIAVGFERAGLPGPADALLRRLSRGRHTKPGEPSALPAS